MCFVKCKEMNSWGVTQKTLSALLAPWAFGHNKYSGQGFHQNPPRTFPSLCRTNRYLASSREEAAKNIPLLFVTCPSTKDPTWETRHPGNG